MSALTKKELDATVAVHRAWRDERTAPAATAPNAALIQSVMRGIASSVAPYIHDLEKQIAALQARVSELERSQKSATPRTDAATANPRVNGNYSQPRRP